MKQTKGVSYKSKDQRLDHYIQSNSSGLKKWNATSSF